MDKSLELDQPVSKYIKRAKEVYVFCRLAEHYVRVYKNSALDAFHNDTVYEDQWGSTNIRWSLTTPGVLLIN